MAKINYNDGTWKADDIKYMEERIQALLEYLAIEKNKNYMLEQQIAFLKKQLDDKRTNN